MSALRGAAVKREPPFDQQVAALKAKYPDIDKALTELEDFLRLGYSIPHMPVIPPTKNTYAVTMDYPPKGAAGRRLFLVTYHATEPVTPTMQVPSRVFTLLTIRELHQS